MQRVVNKALTPWVAENLISGHLAHAGNHKHGSAGHNQGKGRAPKAAVVQVFRKRKISLICALIVLVESCTFWCRKTGRKQQVEEGQDVD